MQRRLRRVDLLIVDELGFVPFDRTGGEILFHILADRYERRSTMVTTNLAFSEWVEIFGDEKLTTALLDRLSHHAHILTPKGASYRRRGRKGKTGDSGKAPGRVGPTHELLRLPTASILDAPGLWNLPGPWKTRPRPSPAFPTAPWTGPAAPPTATTASTTTR